MGQLILVTGGAGFIGSHLLRWLLEQGHTLRVLDNLSSGRPEMLGDCLPAIDLQIGDIRDPQALEQALSGVELVFHLAAMVSVNQSVEQPLQAQAINASASLQLFEAARQAGVRRVVQASSCAVYGNTEQLPVSEQTLPQPLSPYAATKLAAEQFGQLYSRLYGLECVALRFFNVYGPRQDPFSPYAAVVPRFITTLRAGKQPTIYGDGQQSRDFVFVGDIVRALWTAASAPGLGGAVLNVGRGEAISVLQLAGMIAELLGQPLIPQFAAARSGEVRHSCADTRLFQELAGFQASTGLRDGILLTLAQD